MRTQGLGSDVGDFFQGLLKTGTDIYSQRVADKRAAAELAAQRAYTLQQSFPQQVVGTTPGGGMGLLIGLGLIAAVFMLSKRR